MAVGDLADAPDDAVAVRHRDRAVLEQPLVVGLAGQPDHRGAGLPGELDGERADAAGRARHHDGVPRRRPTARTAAYAVTPATNRAPPDLPGHLGRLAR